MKHKNGKVRAGKAPRVLIARRADEPCTARQMLKLAFYHLDAARFLLLSHRMHMEES